MTKHSAAATQSNASQATPTATEDVQPLTLIVCIPSGPTWTFNNVAPDCSTPELQTILAELECRDLGCARSRSADASRRLANLRLETTPQNLQPGRALGCYYLSQGATLFALIHALGEVGPG